MKKVRYLNANLDGDGRRLYSPNPDIDKFADGVKMPMRLSEIRFAVRALTENKHTKHSPRGELLWCLLEWCTLNKYDYSLSANTRFSTRVDARISDAHPKIVGYLFELGDKHS